MGFLPEDLRGIFIILYSEIKISSEINSMPRKSSQRKKQTRRRSTKPQTAANKLAFGVGTISAATLLYLLNKNKKKRKATKFKPPAPNAMHLYEVYNVSGKNKKKKSNKAKSGGSNKTKLDLDDEIIFVPESPPHMRRR